MKNWMILATILTSFMSGNGSLRTAWEHYESGRFKESIESYKEALTHYPKVSTRIYYNLGLCHLKVDSINQAIRYFRQGMLGEDRVAASLSANQLGILMANFQQNKEALRNFKNALVLDPLNEEARYNFEMLKRQVGDDAFASPNQMPENDQPQPPSLSDRELREIWEKLEKVNRRGSNKDLLKPESLDSIPLPVARKLMEEKRKDKTQFIQQLKKAPIGGVRKKKGPDW
ncbi:MAG: tetratricopeptide repeat protein [Bacteroidota bacterium]